MVYTSSEANKLLRSIQNEIKTLTSLADKSAVFTIAQGDNPEDFRPEYNFAETEARIEQLNEKVRIIKHEINFFNANTRIEELNLTIDQVLVSLPQWNARLDVYKTYLNMLPRIVKQGYNTTEYLYTNFNKEDVQKAYDELNTKINRAQILLDRINSQWGFNIPIDD